MTEVLLFGGTTEGRIIAGLLSEHEIPSVVCVATEYGASLLERGARQKIFTGRLDENAMQLLFQKERPRIVIDATHPYAGNVTDNIRAACEKEAVRYVRVLRECADQKDCLVFPDIHKLVSWLNDTPGVIFSTLGSKEATALTDVRNFQERLRLRILPSVEGLSLCLSAGFPCNHIIAMQGPFSKELNKAMFRAFNATILITKESGKTGGFPEKLDAARECAMTTAVLRRPDDSDGHSLEEIFDLLKNI